MNLAGHTISNTRQGIAGRRAGEYAAAFLLLLCACAPGSTAAAAPSARDTRNASAAPSVSFTDELGRTVKIPANVRRIVSLAPNLTEIVYALGAADRLAGDTDFCDFPAEAKLKPHVGGTIDPNLEQIVRLKPDVVLATKTINRRETVDALEQLGVPVYVTDPHSVEDMISSVGHIAAVLNAGQSASALAAELRARVAGIAQRLRGTPSKRVFFVVWTEPLISIGTHTFLADALRIAGAQSVLETSQEWPRVSMEEIVHLQPDYLVFADADAAGGRREVASLRQQPGWRDLTALQKDRVVVISDAINRPAPRMLDAIEQLARALHPNAFSASIRQPDAAPPRLSFVASVAPPVSGACPCAR